MDELEAAFAEARMQLVSRRSVTPWMWRRMAMRHSAVRGGHFYVPTSMTIRHAELYGLMGQLDTITKRFQRVVLTDRSGSVVTWHHALNKVTVSGLPGHEKIFALDTDEGWERIKQWLTQ